MKHTYYFAIALFLFLSACTPKVVEEVVVDDTPDIPVKETPKSNPDCVTFADISPREKDIAENSYVLYRDLVKAEEYTQALPYWKTAFSLAPGADGNIRYHFNDGVAIYKYLYDHAAESEKGAYVDTIMAIHDKRVTCYPDEKSYVDGRKAFDYYYNYKAYISDDELYDLFKSVFDEKGEKVDYFVVNPFTKILHDKVVDGSVSPEEGRKYAHLVESAIRYGSTNCKQSECEAWEVIKGYAPDRLESLEGVKGFYDCNYYADKYYPEYEANPTDCETIQSVYAKMVRGGCPTTDVRLIEVKNKYNANCRKSTPSSGGLKTAYDLYTAGDYEGAVEKFDAFIASTNDVEKKAKYLMLVARIYYRDLKNYPKARSYALKAAGLKSNWGEPYMLIGKLYASSGPLCGPGTGFDSQVVTWVAVDKFNYAKSIDPSVTAEANKLISQYTQYMPSNEVLHLRMISKGSKYKVGCWIQENTTVRTP